MHVLQVVAETEVRPKTLGEKSQESEPPNKKDVEQRRNVGKLLDNQQAPGPQAQGVWGCVLEASQKNRYD